MNDKPWVIYTRVSSDEQARHGASLQAQLETCASYAKTHNLPLGDSVEDGGCSGGNLDRPGMKDLLRRVDAGEVGGIIVWKLDRLTRSLRDLLDLVPRFDALGVGFSSVHERIDTSTSLGRFFVNLMGALAQLERELVSERVRFVQDHKRAKGAYLGGSIATGLKTIQDGRDRRITIDEDTGPTIARIWSIIVDGGTLRDVAKYLDDEGVRPRKCRTWGKGSVAQLVSNRRYIGHLVDAEEFERAQRVLAGRFSPSSAKRGAMTKRMTHQRSADRTWRLQTLAFCARCGMALVGSQSRGSRGVVYPYLRCSGRQKHAAACDAPDLPAEQVEDLVVEAILRGVGEGRVTEALAREQSQRQLSAGPLNASLRDLVLQRDGLRKRIEALLALVEEGGSAAKATAPRIAELQGSLDDVERQVIEIEARLAAASVSTADLATVEHTLRKGLAALPAQSWETQKAVLAGLVQRVEIAAGAPLAVQLGVPLGQVRTVVREWCVI